jgi:hypothetical protein
MHYQTSNMKKILITGILFVSAGIIYAQTGTENDPGSIKRFLEKTHRAYLEADRLSFQVHYRYANSSQPGKYVDSLSGQIAMDKNNARYVIGGMETMVNSKYTIQVLPEEKLIYLSKTRRNAMMDPLNLLDSLLLQAGRAKTTLSTGKQLSTLTIRFDQGQPYKSISITIDRQTGFFQKVNYDLYTKDWVDDAQINQPDRPAPYEKEGRVEIVFTNYQKGKVDEYLFDETMYFTRQGNSFEPSERYNGYRVFVASPNL